MVKDKNIPVYFYNSKRVNNRFPDIPLTFLNILTRNNIS